MNGGCAARVALWATDPEEWGDLDEMLTTRGICVLSTDSGERVRAWTSEGQIHLILAQLSQAFVDPLDFLNWLKKQAAAPPVLIITETNEVPLYLEAMRRGAFDCLGMPLEENEVMRVVARALEASPALASTRGTR